MPMGNTEPLKGFEERGVQYDHICILKDYFAVVGKINWKRED